MAVVSLRQATFWLMTCMATVRAAASESEIDALRIPIQVDQSGNVL